MTIAQRDSGHYILGTAGHIDHGKSTLVRALTHVDPDRLPEEKARGMTIELGFAPLQLGADLLGVVDVPGHEKFVRTMVAGATGIDLALLVVAADDGVMPQTSEHANILDLLGIDQGAVAITKVDAVAPERIEQVRAQIHELLAGTALEPFPVLPVSSTEGTGLDELRAAITTVLTGLKQKKASSVFRMAIDRVFTVRGRGTVVTGSVLSGHTQPGQTLELFPGGHCVKVREVQSHGHQADVVAFGQRAALNLTGIKMEQMHRGQELATPGFLQTTRYFDASIRVLADCVNPVLSHRAVRLCAGTTETLARLVIFGGDRIETGHSGFVQLRPADPLVLQHGQRFILRHETATHTIGGGVVLRPVSSRTASRMPGNLEGLETLRDGDPIDRLSETLRRAGAAECADLQLACRAGLEPVEVEPLRQQLLEKEVLILLPGSKWAWHRDSLAEIVKRTQSFLSRWHARHENEPGFPADRFISWPAKRADLSGKRERSDSAKPLNNYLIARGVVRTQGAYICHPDFAPALSTEDQNMLDTLLNRYAESAFQPPSVSELKAELGRSFPRADRMIQHALSQRQLVRIDNEFILHADVYGRLKETVAGLIRAEGSVTVGRIREALDSTRKFVVPFLEHLDRLRFTRRTGNDRTLV